MSHLGKYLRRSKEKFKKHITYECAGQVDEATLERLVADRLKDELKSGVQTIQYQINPLMTTNGQSPLSPCSSTSGRTTLSGVRTP